MNVCYPEMEKKEKMRYILEVTLMDFVGIIKLFWFVLNNPRGIYDLCKFVWSWMKTNEFRDQSKVLPDPYILDL